MFKVPTRHLILLNGLVWMAVGIKISLTGIDCYRQTGSISAWHFLLSVIVFAGFWMMFTGVVRSYSERILSMPEPRTSVFRTFSLKGYLIIAFMISLGITLRRIPQVPDSFIAWFYCGLGPGLFSAGIRFLLRWRSVLPTNK